MHSYIAESVKNIFSLTFHDWQLAHDPFSVLVTKFILNVTENGFHEPFSLTNVDSKAG